MVPLTHFHLLHLCLQDAAPKQASLGEGQQGRKAWLGCEQGPCLQFLSLSCDLGVPDHVIPVSELHAQGALRKGTERRKLPGTLEVTGARTITV